MLNKSVSIWFVFDQAIFVENTSLECAITCNAFLTFLYFLWVVAYAPRVNTFYMWTDYTVRMKKRIISPHDLTVKEEQWLDDSEWQSKG